MTLGHWVSRVAVLVKRYKTWVFSGDRVGSLDALRGLAALSIVIYHYVCWKCDSLYDLQQATALLPFFPYSRTLLVCYKFAFMAVPIFFCLSGYIFYTKYGATVCSHKISWQSFFLWRFSRLWPLILLTTLIIGWLQYRAYFSLHTFFIWPQYDLFSFFY